MKWILRSFTVIIAIGIVWGAYTPTEVKPHAAVEFSLKNAVTPAMNEYYRVFSFNNIISESKKSDMVIQLSTKANESTKLAIYDSLESIKQNEQLLFIDFIWEESAVKAETIIKQDDPLYKGSGMYYMVFYDLTLDYTSSVTLFNEADIKEMVSLKCYTIPHLYSMNSFIMRIDTSQGFNFLHYTMSTRNHSKNPLVLIKEGLPSSGRLIRYYNCPSASDYILLQTDIKEYHVTISSLLTPYEDFGKMICIELLSSRVKVLSSESSFKRDFIFSMKYYFKVDLKEYSIKEDNEFILTLHDQTAYEAVDELLCKYASSNYHSGGDYNNLSSEVTLFPFNEGENECAVLKDDTVKNTYHLFFRRNDEALDVLLITLLLRKSIVDTFSFNFRQLPRSAFIETEGERKIDITTPLYYRINLNTLQKNMILFSSIKNCQSAIYGSLSSQKKLTLVTYHNQMIVINKPNKISTNESNDQESVVYIKFYDPNSIAQNRLMIKYIDQNIYYVGSDITSQLSLPIHHINCNEPVYFININNQKSMGLISLETLYGKHVTYHLHSYKSQDSIIDMLPNKDNAELLSGPIRLDSEIDMMQINCRSPLLLNVNMKKEDKSAKQAKKGDSFRAFLGFKEEIYFNLLLDKMIGIDVRIESNQSIINVYLNNKLVTQLNEQNKRYKDLILVTNANDGKLIEYPISFSSQSVEGSFIYVAFGSEDLFKTIRGSSTIANQQNIIVELNKNKEYKSALITMETQQEGLSFCYAEGMTSLSYYVPLPKSNCHPLLKTYSFYIENPYDKYSEDSSGIGFYYVAMSFNIIPSLPISFAITYTEKEKAETIKEGTKFLLESKTAKYRLGHSNDDEEDLLLFNINACNKKKVDYKIEINGITYYKQTVEDKNTLTVMKNYLVDPDITFTDSNGIFAYRYVTEEDYKGHVPTSNYSITSSNTVNNYTLSFRPYVKAQVNYAIHIIQSGKETPFPDECQLHSGKPFQVIKDEGLNDKITLLLQLENMTVGEYAVAIIATEESGLQSSAMYDPIRVVVSGKGVPIWVWIVIGVLSAFIVLGFTYVLLRFLKNRKTNEDIENKSKLLTSMNEEFKD